MNYRILFTQAGPFRQGAIVTEDQIVKANHSVTRLLQIKAIEPVEDKKTIKPLPQPGTIASNPRHILVGHGSEASLKTDTSVPHAPAAITTSPANTDASPVHTTDNTADTEKVPPTGGPSAPTIMPPVKPRGK